MSAGRMCRASAWPTMVESAGMEYGHRGCVIKRQKDLLDLGDALYLVGR